MTRSLLPCAVVVLCAVPLGCGYSPDQTLNEVEKALAREDVAAFRETLSAPTIDYLRAWLGIEKVDDGVAFMMGRLRPGAGAEASLEDTAMGIGGPNRGGSAGRG